MNFIIYNRYIIIDNLKYLMLRFDAPAVASSRTLVKALAKLPKFHNYTLELGACNFIHKL